MTSAQLVNVFPLTPSGGNPAPIVLDARDLSDAQMIVIARSHGLESGFVLPPRDSASADFRFRFFVPRHEMEMCGHATIGALWLLREAGRLPAEVVRIETLSGAVTGFVPPGKGAIRITQPRGTVEAVPESALARIRDVLGLYDRDLVGPVLNARTSRVKTLVPLASPARLQGLSPDFSSMEEVCAQTESTGLYPFALDGEKPDLFHARQFPKASGYPEDAATGIAATALVFGLVHVGTVGPANPEVRIRQGESMGRPSEIGVRVTFDESTGEPSGCLLGGTCHVPAR